LLLGTVFRALGEPLTHGLGEAVADGVVGARVRSGVRGAGEEGDAGARDLAQGLDHGLGHVAPLDDRGEGMKVEFGFGDGRAAVFGRIEMGKAAEELDEEGAADATQDSIDSEGLEEVGAHNKNIFICSAARRKAGEGRARSSHGGWPRRVGELVARPLASKVEHF
jgi:hypothetical protein